MDALVGLRQIAYRLRKRMMGRETGPRIRPIEPGEPEDLDPEIFHNLAREQFGAAIQSIAHQHLSGWKESGAYRVFLKTTTGLELPVIYKIARYSEEAIPALQGLPVRPGPAEFAICSQPAGPLEPYLPKVYQAREVEPGLCYHYIFEDLGGEYHRAHEPAEKIQVCKLLPGLHQALIAWSNNNHPPGFLSYGQEFSSALQLYARERLERYAAQVDSPETRELLAHWDQLSELHLQNEFFVLPRQLIHGDSNFSNIHLHNQQDGRMKLVDWEWAGFGTPYADLASLLKGTDHKTEQKGIEIYQRHASLQDGLPSGKQAIRLYHWSQLERGLLDAAFLAAQYLGSDHQANFSLTRAVESAARRVNHTVKILAR